MDGQGRALITLSLLGKDSRLSTRCKVTLKVGVAWGLALHPTPREGPACREASGGRPLCSVSLHSGLSQCRAREWGGAGSSGGSVAPGAPGPGSSHPELGPGGAGDQHSVSEQQAVGRWPAFEGRLGSS